jgi:tellurite resistance protein TerC
MGLDFFVLHKKNKQTTTKKAIGETLFFALNALAFCGVIYWVYSSGMIEGVDKKGVKLDGFTAVTQYLTGYIIELSLSVDNLFVIAVIFTAYKIPAQYQHRLLFLGILGAIVFRALLISAGLVLFEKFSWLTIVFGIFLMWTALRMLKEEEETSPDEDHKPKGIAKLFNISNQIDGDKFVTVVDGKKVFTALFGALITIEFTDLLFALDSIPAIFAVTTASFIVFSSNIFAIMGLRSLYFFLANMLEKFVYLKYSVIVILIFVAVKLIAAYFHWHFPEWVSLAFIVGSLTTGVWISLSLAKNEEKASH